MDSNRYSHTTTCLRPMKSSIPDRIARERTTRRAIDRQLFRQAARPAAPQPAARLAEVFLEQRVRNVDFPGIDVASRFDGTRCRIPARASGSGIESLELKGASGMSGVNSLSAPAMAPSRMVASARGMGRCERHVRPHPFLSYRLRHWTRRRSPPWPRVSHTPRT